MPRSLARFLDSFKRDEREGLPRYIMNVATFAPIGSPDWNGATMEDPPENLWYVYFWMNRGPGRRWNGTGAPPAGDLNLLTSEFEEGVLSHVAFGPTDSSEPTCVFLRNTHGDERWQYQWTGLPFLCERNVQQHIEGGATDTDLKGEALKFKGINAWVGGRLRGVTFGPDGNHVVFREGRFDWAGTFPPELVKAFNTGRNEEWSINVSTPCLV
jgi:hypothetical protein